MKLLLRILSVAIIIFIAAVTIVVANRGESVVMADYPATPSAEPSPSVSIAPSPSPSVEPTPYSGPSNPLSGMPLDSDTLNDRPFAVMLDNIKGAQPLLGLAKADIIFEIPVEGGITRLMALFQDASSVDKIGSVRSARPYFVEIARGYDAVYIHAGGSNQAYSTIKSTAIVHLDGVNGSKQDIFFRDADRKKAMGYEHSLVTSGELISKFLPTYGIALEHGAGYDAGMTFTDSAAPKNGLSAASVKVQFLSSKTTVFKFDAPSGLYNVSQYEKEYIDGNTGKQLGVTNVLILDTDIVNIAGDSAGRLDVTVTGSGAGAYCSGGNYIEIQWTKKSAAAPFVFTLKDGSPLEFGRGITYICVISDIKNAEIT